MAANEPPREAVRQADGSYFLQKEDGSTMRWTRRPDGTWRKPEHVRAGFVGELEQKKYVSKGEQMEQLKQNQMQAQLGRIPGAPPDEEGSKSQGVNKRNERKKEKRREKAEEAEEARLTGKDKASEDTSGSAILNEEMTESAGKNEKNIRKKLRQIEVLEEKQQKGEDLNEDQLAKIANKATLQAELKACLAGETVPAAKPPAQVSQAAPVAAAPAAASASAVAAAAEPVVSAAAAPAPDSAAPTKNRKAIEKKLRQIAEIEEKQRNGETLNADQEAKLATKKELEADLKQC